MRRRIAYHELSVICDLMSAHIAPGNYNNAYNIIMGVAGTHVSCSCCIISLLIM